MSQGMWTLVQVGEDDKPILTQNSMVCPMDTTGNSIGMLFGSEADAIEAAQFHIEHFQVPCVAVLLCDIEGYAPPENEADVFARFRIMALEMVDEVIEQYRRGVTETGLPSAKTMAVMKDTCVNSLGRELAIITSPYTVPPGEHQHHCRHATKLFLRTVCLNQIQAEINTRDAS